MKPADIQIMSLLVYMCKELQNFSRSHSWHCLGYSLYMHYARVLLSLVFMHACI